MLHSKLSFCDNDNDCSFLAQMFSLHGKDSAHDYIFVVVTRVHYRTKNPLFDRCQMQCALKGLLQMARITS